MKDNNMTNDVLDIINGLNNMLERNDIADFKYNWDEEVSTLDLNIIVESQKFTAHIDLSTHKSGDRIKWDHK